MSGLKEIYRTGTAAVTDPALKAERVVSARMHVSTDQLAARQREVAEREQASDRGLVRECEPSAKFCTDSRRGFTLGAAKLADRGLDVGERAEAAVEAPRDARWFAR